MTDKAYIVTNEQQELEVLEKLEREGLTWIDGRNPTERMPSVSSFVEFPYVLFKRNNISWGFLGNLSDEEIAFDGRKEEEMSDKYVVSQEFMNELEDWKDTLTKHINPGYFIDFHDLNGLPETVYMWWGEEVSDEESNNRLIAIIRWVNGEDVFEVEKPKKWVVRSKETNEYGDYRYVYLVDYAGLTNTKFVVGDGSATHFDTKDEAESWANAHQEVIEVNDD